MAITGSPVPSMVARIEPTRTTPAMYSQNAPNVPPITVNAISPTPSQSNCGAVAHGRTNGSSTSPEIRNAMPLTVKLPQRSMSLTGRNTMAAVDAALIAPQIRPTNGSFSVVKSPPVAISTVPAKASATPMPSRTPGSRRPRRHTTPKTNSRFRLCSTVAVPELVQLIDSR